MYIRDGLIPAVLGTAVTATGLALKKTNLPDSYTNGVIGFGVAHIVLGAVDMVSCNMEKNNMMHKASKAINFR